MTTIEEVQKAYLDAALSRPVPAYVVNNKDDQILATSSTPFVHHFMDEADETFALTKGQTYEEKKNRRGELIKFFAAEPSGGELYLSASGRYLRDADLPEHKQSYCLELYEAERRLERNRILEKTDGYLTLADKPVARSSDDLSLPLTEEELTEVKIYRQALRTWPETAGFPFGELPAPPSCIAYDMSLDHGN